MARTRLHTIRQRNSLTFDGVSLFTLGQFSLSDITDGLSNGEIVDVDMICFLSNTRGGIGVYAHTFTCTLAIQRNAGPVYVLTAEQYSDLHDSQNDLVTTAAVRGACSVDQSGGNLRLRYNSAANTTFTATQDCHVALSTIGP